MIERHRKDRLDTGFTPAQFRQALASEVPGLIDRLTNSKLSLLVHYLVQEEFGKVSFDKLIRALNLSGVEAPLPQSKVDEIRA